MALKVILNGQQRTFEGLAASVRLDEVIEMMDLKADRVAVEHNGAIAPRANWADVWVSSGDRLEIVHFVGGGCCSGHEGFQAMPSSPAKGIGQYLYTRISGGGST